MVVLDQHHHELYLEQWQNREKIQMTPLVWKLEGDKAFIREDYFEGNWWQVPYIHSKLFNALLHTYKNARLFGETESNPGRVTCSCSLSG